MNPGDVVSGRYRIIERLGAGGMGAVYRVEQTMMHAPMAMKVLRPEISTTEEMQQRFEREARAAARLDSPYLVRANDFGRAEDGTLFLVMELVEGETLAKRAARGRLSVDASLAIIDQILAGLTHAHAHDVIHRDLKPANIMLVGPEPSAVKILDFGLAKLITGEDARLTQAGMVFGTVRYMSPEQASAREVDHRTDLYSTGVILYFLLTGRTPFEGTESEILRAHLTAPPPALALGLEDRELEAALEELVRAALAKSPEARFQDATIFRTAVQALRARTVERAPPPKASRWPKPSLAFAGQLALFVGLLALIVRAAVISWSASRELEGHLARGREAVEKQAFDGAAKSYQSALELDPDSAADPRLAADAKRMIDRAEGRRLLESIAKLGDRGAAVLLAELIAATDDAGADRIAYQGLKRLDALDRIDAAGVLLGGLERTRTRDCETRKWYVLELGALDDPRVLPALEKEQGRRTGFLFFKSDANGCMKEELDRLVKKSKAG